MNESNAIQLRLIEEIRGALDAAGIDWWLFGGWAVDFHLGRVTREHGDIEIFVWASDGERTNDALARAGFVAPSGLHPDEGRPFLKDAQDVGMWYLVRDDAGVVHTPGRWADWPWSPGSFDEPPARLGELVAPVMSIDGLLDMKLRFPDHAHGAPLRDKDRDDIARLRSLLAAQIEDDW